MRCILVIGAGGVGRVVIHKLAQNPDEFPRIVLASRTVEKCRDVVDSVKSEVEIHQLDADDPARVLDLLRLIQPELVIHVALPYQDLSIMQACSKARVHYLDTANYEPPDVAKFEYSWQWKFDDQFREAGRLAILGCGFDPGMTNAYCAYAQKHLFDEIDTIDILDCNGGTHGRPFATNFNAEINIREVTAPARYFENRQWHEAQPFQIYRPFDFPGIGRRRAYLMYHEELESLAKFVPGVNSLRFWMTFGEQYLTYLEVIQNLGLSRIDEVEYEGRKVVPLKFLKSLLPDARSIAREYKGFTSIGCLITGRQNGRSRRVFLYNVCSHQCAHQEVGAHAISYTTGVPAVAAATLIAKGIWSGAGVFNVEQMDPDPLLTEAARLGLPWQLSEDIDWPQTE